MENREAEIARASMMFMGAAILGGLGQTRTMHPSTAVKIVDGILAEAPIIRQLPPDLRAAVEAHLTEFADMIRSMTAMPANAGRG